MKKFFIILVSIVLLSAACGKANKQATETTKPSSVPVNTTGTPNMYQLGDVSRQYQSLYGQNHPFYYPPTQPTPTPFTLPDDIGTFYTFSPDGSQTYQNNYLGIQFQVPKNWVLDDVYNKNYLIFKDPVDAAANYYAKLKTDPHAFDGTGITLDSWVGNSQTLQIEYDKDFPAWHDGLQMPTDCKTVLSCYQAVQQEIQALEISTSTIDGMLAVTTSSYEGDAPNSQTTIEHNGIYVFTPLFTQSVANDAADVINSIKFLR